MGTRAEFWRSATIGGLTVVSLGVAVYLSAMMDGSATMAAPVPLTEPVGMQLGAALARHWS